MDHNVPVDLHPGSEAPFEWVDGKRRTSLQRLHDAVVEKIDITARWYMRGKKWGRQFGRCARVGAMILAGLAAAWPTIAEIMHRSEDQWWWSPDVATIFALVAAGALLLDRFFGASTGWVRYITCGLALNDLREELEGAWRLECANWATQDEPNIDQTKRAVTLLQGFVTRVNNIVHAETEAWKAEFQTALQQVEEYAKAAPRKVEQSGLKVTIADFEKVKETWTIALNGGTAESVSGPEKAFTFTPGQMQIAVEATIMTGAHGDEEKQVRREELVQLKAGEISKVLVRLDDMSRQAATPAATLQ
jgi:hypothetical protein